VALVAEREHDPAAHAAGGQTLVRRRDCLEPLGRRDPRREPAGVGEGSEFAEAGRIGSDPD